MSSKPIPIWKLWIEGAWREGESLKDIISPWSGQKIAQCVLARTQDIEDAAKAATQCQKDFAQTSVGLRAKLLRGIAGAIKSREEEFVSCIVNEAGKPVSLAQAEVSRAISTFQIAAEEILLEQGQIIRVDRDVIGRSFESALVERFPAGIILGITPFNFPLNLVAHKVAPALARGAPILLKPPPQAPGAATLLAEIFRGVAESVRDEKEWIPLAALQVIHATNEKIETLVKDPRIRILSFTGSDQVGWKLRGLAQKKRVCLELGGDAAVIVHSDVDLSIVAERCAFGSFAYAGQVCISIQRVFVHEKVYDKFMGYFLPAVREIVSGDPNNPKTLNGPVIDDSAETRILSWIEDARSKGAKLLYGSAKLGQRVIQPTVLEDVPSSAILFKNEVFGPVVCVSSYKNFDEALEKVNHSRFGLQAGVFTLNETLISQAYRELEVGGVLINEIPTFRSDVLPYGGVKDSGLGREGVRSSLEEFSEQKVLLRKKI